MSSMHSVEPASGTTLSLRPRGATILSIFVWCILGAMAIEAVLAAGLAGLGVFPGLALVTVLIWAVLWAPRVILHRERVEVRNILHTYHLPFAAIERVRLGAMLRFDLHEERRGLRSVTAWNAPGIRRDLGAGRGRAEQESRTAAPAPTSGTARRRALSAGERLRHDQQASRSSVIRDRGEAWAERQDGRSTTTTTSTAGTAKGQEMPHAERRLNVVVLAVLGGVLLANALNILL